MPYIFVQVDAAHTNLRFTAVELSVSGCGQLVCQLQIVHRAVWDALNAAFTPLQLAELERVGYLLTPEERLRHEEASCCYC